MSAQPTVARGVPSAAQLGRPIRILLVEDSPGDARLCGSAFRRARVPNELTHVHDGEAAMVFLRGEPPHEQAARPDLILLDLNMPRKDGRETLREIKDDRCLRSIPVVVLTTSNVDRDVMAAYDHYAAGYVTKPVDFEQFLEVVRRLEDFWLNVVCYPTDYPPVQQEEPEAG